MPRLIAAAVAASLLGSTAATAMPPAAIFTDPPHDAAHPARSEVLHIPTGGVEVNGLVYIAAGAGVHPTLVLFHGLPGNEKNLDLAQAVRRAGWNVVTMNYRGSWGSPGAFSFRGDLDDAKAVLAYIRDPKNAARLQIDPTRIAVAGHSMGGWVTALTAAHDPDLLGAILISAADIASIGAEPHNQLIKLAAENQESLAGVTDVALADQLAALGPMLSFAAAAPGLVHARLLVLSASDGLAPMTDRLVADIHRIGGTQVKTVHVDTDHNWSDDRIRLESEIITWLDTISAKPTYCRSLEQVLQTNDENVGQFNNMRR